MSGPPHRQRLGVDRSLRAVVLAGGLTFEREVVAALRHARSVEALRPRRRRRRACGTPTPSCCPGWPPHRPTPSSSPCTARRARTAPLRAVLDLAGVPYVGSTRAACRLAWDKPAAKSVVRTAGLPDAGLGGAAAQHVPRARRRRGARPDRRPARAAADGQAGPGRLGAGRADGPRASRSCRPRWSAASPTATPCWSSGSSRASSWRCRVVDLGDGP